MPGFNGTGPIGQGPLTGGGRGFCVAPVGYVSDRSIGYAGVQGYPVNYRYPSGANYGRNYIPSYNYPYYPTRGVPVTGAAAGFGYFGRGRRSPVGIGRGRSSRGMGRRF